MINYIISSNYTEGTKPIGYHPQGDKQQCCVFSRAQKLPQSTWQAQTVVSSSLTPQRALLVPISGPIDPVVDRRGFTGSEKDRL